MTTAELVNLIRDRLINAKVTFDVIDTGFNAMPVIQFRYGGVKYVAQVAFGFQPEIIGVLAIDAAILPHFAQWIEGVLNGRTASVQANHE